MIPKTIHYVWLSGEPYPALIERCMRSWHKHMPDYQLRQWSMADFDIHSVPFVEEACSARKWAFATDYIRLHALYTEGGIYLDTDVLLKQSLEPIFSSSAEKAFITPIEKTFADSLPEGADKPTGGDMFNIYLQAAAMASTPGHPFLAECMEHYRTHRFIRKDGTLDREIAPRIYARTAEKHGLQYADVRQELSGGATILPSYYVASGYRMEEKGSYAVHVGTAIWRDESCWKRWGRRFLNRFPQLFRLASRVRCRILKRPTD